ncbi:MAG: hypothetical protein D6688_12445, partial [Alphaproteobacteria bacterium]
MTALGTASARPAAAQPSPADTVRLDLRGAVARALAVSPEVAIEAAGQQYAEARYGLARASRYLTEFTFT